MGQVLQVSDVSSIDLFDVSDELKELHEQLKEDYMMNFMLDMTSVYEGFEYKVEGKDVVVVSYDTSIVDNGKLTIPEVFDGISQTDKFNLGNEVLEFDLGRSRHISHEQFMGAALKKIVGNSVTIVGEKAFFTCPQLSDVELPVAVHLQEKAFMRCNNLVSVKFPAVRVVEDAVFMECENLKECDIHGARMAGGNTGRQEAPVSLFEGCKALSKLDISGALSLGKRALYGCISLKELELRLCRVFEEYSLAYCESLETLYLDNLLGFKESALEGCVSLKNLNYYGNHERWSQVMIESEVELNVIKQANITIDYKDPEEEANA